MMLRKWMGLALAGVLLISVCGLGACRKGSAGDTQYTIRAEYADGTLTAEMTVRAKNTSDVPLDALKFELWANAYRAGAKYAPISELFARSAYYAGESYGGMRIRGISGAESFSVGGEDDNILTAALKSPLKPGESAEITISFDVDLAKVDHRLGVTAHTVNLTQFYPALCYLAEDGFKEYVYAPLGDPFVSERADFDVTLTLPEEQIPVCGFVLDELADDNLSDGKRTYHVRAEGVRDIAFVLGEDFRSVSEKRGDTEIVYYYYADETPDTTLKAAADSLAYFSENFGAYPYARYTVAETDLVYGGMEYSALSLISSDLMERETVQVVAHETAHQWWYGIVGSNQFEHAWQDESLAEYSAALFLGACPEYGVTYGDFIATSERAYRAYFSVYSQLNGEADTRMDRPLTQYAGDYEYRNIAYDKGVILFDRIKDVIGERKLMHALKRYATDHAGKMASPEDLIECFRKSGANVSALFASFREGKCVI